MPPIENKRWSGSNFTTYVLRQFIPRIPAACTFADSITAPRSFVKAKSGSKLRCPIRIGGQSRTVIGRFVYEAEFNAYKTLKSEGLFTSEKFRQVILAPVSTKKWVCFPINTALIE